MCSFLINPYIYAAAAPGFENDYSMNFDWTSTSANVEYLKINNQSNAIDSAIRDSTPNFSFSGWFKVNNSYLGQHRRIFCKYDNFAGVDRCFLFVLNASNRLQFYGQRDATNATANLETTQTFSSSDGWVHFCFVYDSSQTTTSTIAKLYVNGTEVTSFVTQTVSTTHKYFMNQTTESNRAWVGTCDFAGASIRLPYLGFGGQLDEITFWDKSLSSSEITEMYNSGDAYDISLMPAYSSNCLAWWRMGDDSGDNWDGSKWNIINVKGTASTDLESVKMVEADRVTDAP